MPSGRGAADKRILSRIRKLLRLARDNAASVPEAASALAQAHRLMEKHRLDAAVVGADERDVGRVPVWAGTRIPPWRRQLWAVLARANGCTAVAETRGGTIEISICGRADDALLVRDLERHVTHEVDRLGLAAWAAAPFGTKEGAAAERWRDSFGAGAVWEVDLRLRDAAAAVRREARAEQGEAASTAILVVDGRVAQASAWMHEHVKPGSADERELDVDPRAFAAGVDAAADIGLVRESRRIKKA